MKTFQLTTQDSNGTKLIIDFNEFEILSLINLCWRRRYNKNIGLKLGKIYLETGNTAKENLTNMGIVPEEINDSYKEMKKLLGEIH